MRSALKSLCAILVGIIGSGTAVAADIGPAAAPTQLPVVTDQSSPQFRWGGWFIAAYTATTLPLPSSFSGVIGVGVGYDHLLGERFVVGMAASAHIGFGSFNRTDAQINVRAGGLVVDRLLAYGRLAVGIGDHLIPFSRGYWYHSIGGELAVTPSWSTFTEIGWLRGFGTTSSDLVIVGGVNWWPGRQ